MLIIIRSETPLPMPRSVIWSPSHITNIEAPVMQIIVETKKRTGSMATTASVPRPMEAGLSIVVANAPAWKTQMAMVR